MRLEFVQLQSTDKLKLPGLLYTPDKPSKKLAIWLHGMGDNGMFYNPTRINALGTALTDKGIALLSFNNRGAHDQKTLSITDSEDKFQGGTHYEIIADCVKDIDGALAFAKERKYSQYYLLGHSSGANKICVYNDLAVDNPFSKYVLAGPGDDTGLYFSELGEEAFREDLAVATEMVEAGKPLALMPETSGMHLFSAQATQDILDPDGHYNTFPFYELTTKRLGFKPVFKEYREIDKPTLVVYGELDEYAYTAGTTSDALIMFEDHTNEAVLDASGFLTIPGADHGFHGKETQFAGAVADWLAGDVS